MHERLGVQPWVVAECLGHVSGHKQGVAGTYNLSTYLDLRRIASAKWPTMSRH